MTSVMCPKYNDSIGLICLGLDDLKCPKKRSSLQTLQKHLKSLSGKIMVGPVRFELTTF